jgi:tetratricopeptide (TPR) repeat protein
LIHEGGIYRWHRCDTKPNLEIANHAVMAAKASGVVKYIASAVWCLGTTYTQLGDYNSSYDHLREAYRLFNTLPPGEVKSHQLVAQCGIDLVDTARLVLGNADEIVSLARDIERKCAALSDNIIRARSLVLLGIVLRQAQQPQEALRYLDQARTMLKTAGNIYNLANAYQITSWVHYEQGRLPEALDAIEEAWKLVQLTGNVPAQATISLDFGKILSSTNRDTEAWEYLEISLMKGSYIGNRLVVARALEYMGYGYLHGGDYQNAYGAYEAAAEKYVGTIEAPATRSCEENMARIKRKEENADMVIGFYRPASSLDSEILFYPLQAFASELPISEY